MRDLASFANAHRGGSIVVCGCGESLAGLAGPERFVTIGVNDVGRLFDPDYLVVVDPRERFKGERFHYVETSRARYLFTQRPDLGVAHPNLVLFRLGQKDGTDFTNPNVLHYSVITPYVALCLALHMGAANIGLIGVDFTENHFFGATGTHEWAPHVASIDAQFGRLSRAALARGARLFNLSDRSRLTALPRISLETFASLRPATAPTPLSIVSYATSPIAGVPAILARCINARTPHRARSIWARGSYGNGIEFAGDLDWSVSNAHINAELDAADVVIVHNGKIAEAHRPVLAEKPVVTLAHNYKWNVDDTFVQSGFPGLIVGQYQATLPEFAGWLPVPNPIPAWEPEYTPGDKSGRLTIAYTPNGKHDVYPRQHPLYWHSKGYAATAEILDRLAARYPIELAVLSDGPVPHAQALAMKARAHIVIDECVTGSYHRNSLEGLACGAVVLNAVGMRPDIATMLERCASGEAGNPFICVDLASLEPVLEALLELDPDLLRMLGSQSRAWLDRHWDFAEQWNRFWQPAVDTARQRARDLARIRPARPRPPDVALSVVIVSHNEGDFLRRTVDSIRATLPSSAEIVVVDDGSTDGSADFLDRTAIEPVTLVRGTERLGAVRARNLGARHASGAIVVFSDAHVAVSPGWAGPLTAALADPAVGAVCPAIRVMQFPQDYETDTAATSLEARGYGMRWRGANLNVTWLPKKSVTPFAAPLMSGAFLAMRRNLFAAVGGFDPGLQTWGSEDAELSLRLWLLGFRCLVVPEIDVAHQFRPTYRPFLVGWETAIHNKLRVAAVHFDKARQERVHAAYRTHPAYATARAMLAAGDSETRRDALMATRLHDDQWFFDQFEGEPTDDDFSNPRISLEPMRF